MTGDEEPEDKNQLRSTDEHRQIPHHPGGRVPRRQPSRPVHVEPFAGRLPRIPRTLSPPDRVKIQVQPQPVRSLDAAAVSLHAVVQLILCHVELQFRVRVHSVRPDAKGTQRLYPVGNQPKRGLRAHHRLPFLANHLPQIPQRLASAVGYEHDVGKARMVHVRHDGP